MIGYFLLLLCIIQISLGIWLLTKYEKGQATFWYGFFSFAVAIYVGANGLGYLKWVSPDIAEHFAWFGGMATAALFLPFSYMYPIKRKHISELVSLTLWPLAVFFFGIFFSEAFILHVSGKSFHDGYGTSQGPQFWFMVGIFGFYWTWALINLVRSSLVLSGPIKKNLGYVIIGTVASLGISIIFDVVAPITSSNPAGYFGSIATSIWLFVTVYIIVRA